MEPHEHVVQAFVVDLVAVFTPDTHVVRVVERRQLILLRRNRNEPRLVGFRLPGFLDTELTEGHTDDGYVKNTTSSMFKYTCIQCCIVQICSLK